MTNDESKKTEREDPNDQIKPRSDGGRQPNAQITKSNPAAKKDDNPIPKWQNQVPKGRKKVTQLFKAGPPYQNTRESRRDERTRVFHSSLLPMGSFTRQRRSCTPRRETCIHCPKDGRILPFGRCKSGRKPWSAATRRRFSFVFEPFAAWWREAAFRISLGFGESGVEPPHSKALAREFFGGQFSKG
jgi:hypothetical protein